MSIITNLKRETLEILDRFNKDITSITLNNDFGRVALLRRADKLFYALNRLNIEEFAKIFTVYNFSSLDIQENEKYQEALNYLNAEIIKKYSQSDLLRYFLPAYLSQKESKPEYSNYASSVNYWIQLIGFWLRQLRNKPIYLLKPEFSEFADSIKYIKNSLNNAYIPISVGEEFRKHLAVLRERILENTIFPRNKISRANLSSNQEYHEKLVLHEKELRNIGSFLKELQNNLHETEIRLIEKENEILTREELASKKEYENREVAELLREERTAVQKELVSLKAAQESIHEERETSKTKIETLQEKILILDKETSIEKRLKAFAKKFAALPQASQSIKAQNEDSISGSFYSVPEEINLETKLSRSLSYASFFFEQPARETDSSLSTTKSNNMN